ncbi:5-dehydro-4-deoxyglucarate dehydratase [Microterricola pindariensis]|uniref:Probable 5-dehydro-4-deoxyglucarate dehydratase n=1 Tax=Microterricola pindariensis TaxID=478010 RepID=A0ABX5AVM2_9MICO|nr:5-dehydro-4-deoxyglucarate dehydratase [Microterricola pindariensis]PPL18945.1 5-dehydro-4-deoxyglucarate dehydratase [Microterricola pindariensis]
MTAYSPEDLAAKIGSGLLSFPVTAFADDLSFDEKRYREHVAWMSSHDVAGLFAAGGTGEFFSLTNDEISRVVTAAVDEASERVPVLAPAGGSLPNAIEQARIAEQAGAAGILLFPPYLTEASQDGLAAYIEGVCASTSLGVVVYSRANMSLQADTVARVAERNRNLIGFKDGVGSIDQMTRIYSQLGDRLIYIGGLPTAETFALPYLELGVTTYSSAMFNFVPEFALSFYAAVRARDHDFVFAGLRDFVLPFLEIRDRKQGYAVSIIKAGLNVTGREIGRVRPPLTDLTEAENESLRALIQRVQ